MLSLIRQITFGTNHVRPILFNHQNCRFVSDGNVLTMFKTKPATRIVSTYEPNAKAIISALKVQDYDKVKVLARKSNINGHDWLENTPLTDASSRGDDKAVKFLISELGASPHATCHCPDHKTALHYASEYGHKSTVELLLKLGADPNLLDSRKYKALDVAKNDSVRNVLIEHKQNTYKLMIIIMIIMIIKP